MATKNNSHLHIRISEDLKQAFKVFCTQFKITYAEAIKNYIDSYNAKKSEVDHSVKK